MNRWLKTGKLKVWCCLVAAVCLWLALDYGGDYLHWSWRRLTTLLDRFTYKPTYGIGLGAPKGAPLSGVWSIAAGSAHTCAVTEQGRVKCWGWNSARQLGSTQLRVGLDVWPYVVDVDDLTGVSAITAGDAHTCALTLAGEVKCWGYNADGQLGTTTVSELRSGVVPPVAATGLTEPITKVTAGGGRHTCALSTSGLVRCWGFNRDGQVGNGSLPLFGFFATSVRIATDVVGLSSGVTAISAGVNHSCAPMREGDVKCWGSNSFGKLGDGRSTNRHAPVIVQGLPGKISGIATGREHSCALVLNGEVACWGSNDYGQLGSAVVGWRALTPVVVRGLTDEIAEIACGGNHTCARTKKYAVLCWGDNRYGQLGDGTAVNERASPAGVAGLAEETLQIVAGANHTCALTAQGDVTCWGDNEHGQLGAGDRSGSRVPIAPASLQE
jgi:alpha-tubulin suppressor-like RCC1 family protein